MEVGASFIARRMRQNPAMMDQLVDVLASQKEKSAKPFLAIAHLAHVEDVMIEMRKKLLERGVATFGDFASAAQAFARSVGYWRFRAGLE
jgi:hypothetical protein